MARYKITLTDSDLASFRKLRPSEFLALYAIPEGRQTPSRATRFPSPVHLSAVAQDEHTRTRFKIATAPELFATFEAIAVSGGLIVSCAWRGGKLGAHGLHALNTATRTAAKRAGGKKIVRHWLNEIRGAITPTRGDFAALLDYLEIRPIFTQTQPQASNLVKHYVKSRTLHNAGKGRGKTHPRHARKARR